MGKINFQKWKYFKVSNLFVNIKSCKCSNAGSLLENGNDIYYIGAKKNNNGVMKKVKYNRSLTSKGNCIIFICDGQGSVGYTNYIDRDFIGSTTLSVGYNKNLNKYTGIFLVTVLDKERFKYSYGRKYKANLDKIKILLPAIKKNNNEYEPNWEYMENYIKEKYDKIEKQFKTKNSNKYQKIKINDWKSYKIKEIFKIINGKGITIEEINEIEDGSIPCIQGGELNFGILGNFSKEQINDKKYIFINEMSLTLARVGTSGTINFHEKCFIGDKAKALVLLDKYKNYKNKYIYLFLQPLLQANRYRYAYGRGIVNEVYENIVIKLPSIKKSNGTYEPHWQYMEDYIKSLPYGDLI